MYICICICTYVCVFMCTYVYVYICICICTSVYVCPSHLISVVDTYNHTHVSCVSLSHNTYENELYVSLYMCKRMSTYVSCVSMRHMCRVCRCLTTHMCPWHKCESYVSMCMCMCMSQHIWEWVVCVIVYVYVYVHICVVCVIVSQHMCPWHKCESCVSMCMCMCMSQHIWEWVVRVIVYVYVYVHICVVCVVDTCELYVHIWVLIYMHKRPYICTHMWTYNSSESCVLLDSHMSHICIHWDRCPYMYVYIYIIYRPMSQYIDRCLIYVCIETHILICMYTYTLYIDRCLNI